MKIFTPEPFASLALGILVLALPAGAAAQGFGIYEQSTCQMARAGAGLADSCEDGSAMFCNPAGLTGEEGLVVSGGLTGIAALGEFLSDRGVATELDNDVVSVPHAYAR